MSEFMAWVKTWGPADIAVVSLALAPFVRLGGDMLERFTQFAFQLGKRQP